MKQTALQILVLAAALHSGAQAQLLLQVDASAPAKAPTTGYLKLGTAVAPGGHTLAVNSQYLLRDGKPWLPVMGEFHYTRSPAATWDAELQKVSTDFSVENSVAIYKNIAYFSNSSRSDFGVSIVNTPRRVNTKSRAPFVVRLPPYLLRIFRTFATVRVGLSVAVSTTIPTPYGAYPSYNISSKSFSII